MPTTYAIPNGRTVMDATTYTGNGSTQSIVNSDLGSTGFKPDLIWIKSRSNAYNNFLTDSVRGATQYLISNATDAEGNAGSAGITAFNTNGFSMGSGTALNGSGATYVGWQWQAGQGTTSSNTSGTYTSTVSVNATAGFSIVTYTGTGSAGTVGHGLGVAPKMIISKNRSAAENWRVAHIGLTNMASWHCNLDTTQAQSNSGAAVWNNTTPTSTIFGVGTDTSVSGSGNGIVAYCWAEVAGFSKFGSYTGNGSTDGPFVYTGFRPKFVMWKRTDTTADWVILDSTRDAYNQQSLYLLPNSSAAEVDYTSSYPLDFLSNGWKLRQNAPGGNANGGTYIYAAFAENPLKFANAR